MSLIIFEPIIKDGNLYCCRQVQIEYHVEAGLMCHKYYRYREANEHFATARKLSNLDIELTGINIIHNSSTNSLHYTCSMLLQHSLIQVSNLCVKFNQIV